MVERGIVKANPRDVARSIKTAMQGDVIRALVELITNSDDSYIRLEDDGKTHTGVIEILYRKQGYCGVFSVRDHAEGMSIDKVRDGFTEYGGKTSGLFSGGRVRGYFGHGAKDALAGMSDGELITIRDGSRTACKLWIEKHQTNYELGDVARPTARERQQLGIPENGTIATFRVDPEHGIRVPQFAKVQEELANNYLLRKIMSNQQRKVILSDEDRKEQRTLRYRTPSGSKVVRDSFSIQLERAGEFPVDVEILVAEGELTQTTDDRQGGLLILDDENAVLDISLFKYENEPFAARIFGEVRIHGFRRLLEAEEPVLKEERDGLQLRHPFCQKLIPEIESRLEQVVRQERAKKQKEAAQRFDAEEQARYRKAFNLLNEIVADEQLDAIKLGGEPTPEPVPPESGLAFFPVTAKITVGKRFAFQLRVNKSIIGSRAELAVTSSNPRIRLISPKIKLIDDTESPVVCRYVTVEGTEPNVHGVLKAHLSHYSAEANVDVVPEEEVFLDGMVFHPATLNLRPNQPRKVWLSVYVKSIPGGSVVKITCDKKSVRFSRDSLIVNEADAVKNVAKYEIDVWGEGGDESAIVTAECDPFIALLEVNVSYKEKEQLPRGAGMFSEPEFSYELEPSQRASYSRESGKVIIYVNFPSVRHYLGENCQYKKSLPAQVLIADLVAERCFYEIAKRKVEASGAVLRAEAVEDRIKRDAYSLSKKYGKKLHEMLVEQQLLRAAKESVSQQPS
jgi:hypothetical protein